MKLKLTDKQLISKRNCEIKGCPNKASAIFKRKFLCKECNRREHPTLKDRNPKYINYILYPK